MGANQGAIPLVQTQNSEVNQLQQNVTQAVNPILNNPITNGNYLKAQALNSGANTINHKLGRAIQGYMICGSSSAVTFSDNLQSNQNASSSFILTVSGATTANIYCF